MTIDKAVAYLAKNGQPTDPQGASILAAVSAHVQGGMPVIEIDGQIAEGVAPDDVGR